MVDRDAIAHDHVAADVLQPLGILQQARITRDRGQEPLGQEAYALRLLGRRLMHPAFKCERIHLPEQLGCGSHHKARKARGFIVTGDQTPKLAVDDDGNRKRGAHPHVAKIFDMHRRHGSGDRHGQIERLHDAPDRRKQRGRSAGHIGDDAKGVAKVKGPSLHRECQRQENAVLENCRLRSRSNRR